MFENYFYNKSLQIMNKLWSKWTATLLVRYVYVVVCKYIFAEQVSFQWH